MSWLLCCTYNTVVSHDKNRTTRGCPNNDWDNNRCYYFEYRKRIIAPLTYMHKYNIRVYVEVVPEANNLPTVSYKTQRVWFHTMSSRKSTTAAELK